MRPDLTGPGHQIIATRTARLWGRHRRHALLPPALGEAERADQAEGDVAIRAAIEDGLHELGIVDVAHCGCLCPHFHAMLLVYHSLFLSVGGRPLAPRPGRAPGGKGCTAQRLARRMFCAENIGPTICNPIGRPSTNPQGTEAAGWRGILNGPFSGVQSNPWGKRVASGVSTPAVKAVMGTVGVSSRS